MQPATRNPQLAQLDKYNNMRLLPFLLLIFLWSCNNDTSQKTPAETTTPVETTAPAATSKGEVLYPIYPEAKLRYLFENTDYIDYVYYELPMSMSLKEKGSVQYAISHVSLQAPKINANCKSLGRIFYQLKGENIAEAEMVFNAPENCSYFVFYENGKKAYANEMTDQGKKYLQDNIMNAVKSMQQAAQGQGQN